MHESYALWSIWREISILYRFVVLVLCGLGVYTLYSAITTLLRLREIKAKKPNDDPAAARQSLAILDRRCANVRQAIGAAFLLFGTALFLGLPNSFATFGDGPRLPFLQIEGNFALHFAFGANVFFIFLILHLIQWIVWRRLSSCQLRLRSD